MSSVCKVCVSVVLLLLLLLCLLLTPRSRTSQSTSNALSRTRCLNSATDRPSQHSSRRIVLTRKIKRKGRRTPHQHVRIHHTSARNTAATLLRIANHRDGATSQTPRNAFCLGSMLPSSAPKWCRGADGNVFQQKGCRVPPPPLGAGDRNLR